MSGKNLYEIPKGFGLFPDLNPKAIREFRVEDKMLYGKVKFPEIAELVEMQVGYRIDSD